MENHKIGFRWIMKLIRNFTDPYREQNLKKIFPGGSLDVELTGSDAVKDQTAVASAGAGLGKLAAEGTLAALHLLDAPPTLRRWMMPASMTTAMAST